jgi:hypothetical protein
MVQTVQAEIVSMTPTEKVLGQPEQGYFLQPVSDRLDREAHHWLGQHGEGEWPECPVCDAPLKALMRLNTKDLRLNLSEIPGIELPLLICPQHLTPELQYSLTSAGELLVSDADLDRDIGTDAHASIVLPAAQQILLHAIPDRIAETRELASEGRLLEAAEWARRFDWHQPQNQVGGLPVLMNFSRESPNCSMCGQKMPFLASIVVEVESPNDPEASILQMLYFLCRDCANVASVPDIAQSHHS